MRFVLVVDPDADLSVSAQIEHEIRDAILSGELRPGDKLATLDEYAERLGVSRDTVGTAIRTLVEQGYLDGRRRQGTWVAKPPATEIQRWVRSRLGLEIGRLLRVGISATEIETAFEEEMRRRRQERRADRRAGAQPVSTERRARTERRTKK